MGGGGGVQGGGYPGAMGAGSLREAGEEGAGGGISKRGWEPGEMGKSSQHWRNILK